MKVREIDTLRVKVFRAGDYIIEVVRDSKGAREAWLRHKEYGISRLMFGCGSEYGEAAFIELIEANLDDEIEFYEEEVQDHDNNL